ncbi:hypothetical protein DFO77_11716 [Marinilabilia salmonicolor]|uniref:Uncharacterized protein n=1 Tax=Marinilabilia salmonicolor TaxID=989 RepID=A0A368UW17_9BACT|nr:hypothetical protein DFO77_11716 [Marinilabilia salmonicolor]
MQEFLCKSFKKVAPAKVNCQHITVQRNVIIVNDCYYLKSAVACPFSGPAVGGKA